MARITIEHIQHLVDALDKHIAYKYINPSNKSSLRIGKWTKECAFNFKLIYTNRDEQKRCVTKINLTKIIANIYELVPFSIDAIVNASGNWRAGFESILAHTSEFYVCKIRNQKHLVWVPESPHESGSIVYWADSGKLRSLTTEATLAQNTLVLDVDDDLQLSQDETVQVLHDLYKREDRKSSRVLFGMKYKNIIENHLDEIIKKIRLEEDETEKMIKEDICCGMRMFDIFSENKYGTTLSKATQEQPESQETKTDSNKESKKKLQ